MRLCATMVFCYPSYQIGVDNSHLNFRGRSTMKLSTTFHPQTDGQAEHTIQTLEDMLRSCIIYFKGSRYRHLPLVEFSNNNNFHSSISMAPYESLYGRRCRSPIVWFEVGEPSLLGPELIYKTLENVHIIRNQLQTAYSRQRYYADNRRRGFGVRRR